MKKFFIICPVVILLLFSFFTLYCLGQQKIPKKEVILSPNAIQYEFNKNNLLGLKSIIKDEKKFIYELSSNKYLTRAKVKRINNSEYTSIIGIYFDRDSCEYIEKALSDTEIYCSGNSTYIIVISNSDNFDYTGMHLYFDNGKRISIRFDNEAVVSKAKLDYTSNTINQISQKYSNNIWGKPQKSIVPINPYR